MSVPSEELSLVERYLAADPAALAAAAADWRDGAERLRRAYDAVADALPLVREGAGHSRTGRRAGEALSALVEALLVNAGRVGDAGAAVAAVEAELRRVAECPDVGGADAIDARMRAAAQALAALPEEATTRVECAEPTIAGDGGAGRSREGLGALPVAGAAAAVAVGAVASGRALAGRGVPFVFGRSPAADSWAASPSAAEEPPPRAAEATRTSGRGTPVRGTDASAGRGAPGMLPGGLAGGGGAGAGGGRRRAGVRHEVDPGQWLGEEDAGSAVLD